MYTPASRQEMPRKLASTRETTGLKCPPDTEHQDDREQPCGRGRRVLEQLQAHVGGRQRVRGHARADYERRQEGRAEQLGKQSAREGRRSGHSATSSLSAYSAGSPALRTSSATVPAS